MVDAHHEPGSALNSIAATTAAPTEMSPPSPGQSQYSRPPASAALRFPADQARVSTRLRLWRGPCWRRTSHRDTTMGWCRRTLSRAVPPRRQALDTLHQCSNIASTHTGGVEWPSEGFTSYSTQNRSFRRRSSQPISRTKMKSHIRERMSGVEQSWMSYSRFLADHLQRDSIAM